MDSLDLMYHHLQTSGRTASKLWHKVVDSALQWVSLQTSALRVMLILSRFWEKHLLQQMRCLCLKFCSSSQYQVLTKRDNLPSPEAQSFIMYIKCNLILYCDLQLARGCFFFQKQSVLKRKMLNSHRRGEGCLRGKCGSIYEVLVKKIKEKPQWRFGPLTKDCQKFIIVRCMFPSGGFCFVCFLSWLIFEHEISPPVSISDSLPEKIF